MEDRLFANAELVRTVARDQLGVSVEYDEAGVQWLDRYIDGQRVGAADATKEKLPNTLGSYLGECIRQSFGGTWVQDLELGWGIRVNERITAFPFSKVRKQLADSDGESVLGFYKAIAAMVAEPAVVAAPNIESAKRPWWKLL
ncbi:MULTISPECIES: hypothetical protein [Xanthomonas]|uniref:hypothetical protein n=1 Tax=Xanthomonas TaxID=338 RepID=UPI0005C2853E|nr:MULTISPECIES: hypothetical protein [Xanthomonas]MCW0456905.1 hypothetical protein [Xanthomonas sacchari]